MRPNAIVQADIKSVLNASKGLWPTLSTKFPMIIDVIVDATEKMAKMKPVHVAVMPLSSRNTGRKGAAKQKLILHRRSTSTRMTF